MNPERLAVDGLEDPIKDPMQKPATRFKKVKSLPFGYHDRAKVKRSRKVLIGSRKVKADLFFNMGGNLSYNPIPSLPNSLNQLGYEQTDEGPYAVTDNTPDYQMTLADFINYLRWLNDEHPEYDISTMDKLKQVFVNNQEDLQGIAAANAFLDTMTKTDYDVVIRRILPPYLQ